MKQYYCFLERFNNYFNRKLIKYESLEDYQSHSEDFFIPTLTDGKPTPFDFNPNDNIATEIIANEVPFDPDYFLLLDEESNIVSRWFVIEQKRNRQGQWLYIIRRDVLADSLNELVDAPMYVERGVISNIDSPLLMNNEDLRVNQIKKQEILLKDKTNCAWLVLYLKKGILGSAEQITIDVPDKAEFDYEELSTPITQWQYYQYVQNDYKTIQSFTLTIYSVAGYQDCKYMVDSNGNTSIGRDYTLTPQTSLRNVDANTQRVKNAYSPELSSIKSNLNTDLSYKDLAVLMAYNGRTIRDSDGKYFKVLVQKTTSGSTKYDIKTDNAPLTKNKMNICWNIANNSSQTANDYSFDAKINYVSYRVVLEELTSIDTTIDFSLFTGTGTTDSMLFDAVCMPYGTIEEFFASEVSVDLTTSAERSLRIMNSIARQLTSEKVLDLQLLPYCPIPNLVNDEYIEEGGIVVPEDDIDKFTIYAMKSSVVTDALLICPSSNFTFDIEHKIEIEDDSDVPDTYKLKYINDCTILRLCSPNYNGLFEFNLAKNGGTIARFNVDITLRPFNPYIHVNPDFSFLYGQDFNDVRGLICNGDFSLGIINDAWNIYEIQNKNYQAIFDRQIQNLDINNKITMEESLWSAVAGTVQGTASGAVAGAVVGGGYGAVAGAVVGGVASGIGGALDIENLRKRQQEARSYAVDNYKLSLGNVQALPYSITKTSALTANNKLFPFIEVYECSEEEKEAYYLKLQYNGMTVGKIGFINNYRSEDNSHYFRARVIRINQISEDNHFYETINEELMKGVYI